MSTDRVLSLRGAMAGYDGTPVVRDLDLDVAAGEIVALLGPNGAGKTTTLKTISGLLPLLGGEMDVLGEPVPEGRAYQVARRGVGHVTEDRSLFYALTARENLRLARRESVGRRRAATDRILEIFPELDPLLDRPAGLLSGGQQQMLAMARAMVSRPRLLLIDEMSLGLAPVIVQRLLPVVRAAADEHDTAVLLVEQHVGMALEVADRALVLSSGRVTLEGSAQELAQSGLSVEASYLGGGSS